MTDIITPQAGWYPDPTDSRAYRWWSGGAWTDHLTAAPTVEAVWDELPAASQVAVDPDTFDFTEQDTNPFSSSYEEPWSNTVRPAEKNRTGLVVVIVGLLSVAGYLGSLAISYSTIFPLIPAFYNHPKSADEMAREFAARVLQHLGLRQPGAYRWKG